MPPLMIAIRAHIMPFGFLWYPCAVVGTADDSLGRLVGSMPCGGRRTDEKALSRVSVVLEALELAW